MTATDMPLADTGRMRGGVEFAGFLVLAVALHLALAIRLPAPDGGSTTGGQGGAAEVSLAAAPPGMAELVEAWETPPDPAATVDPVAPQAPPEAEAPPADLPAADAPPPAAAPAPAPDAAAAETAPPPPPALSAPLPPAPQMPVALPDMAPLPDSPAVPDRPAAPDRPVPQQPEMARPDVPQTDDVAEADRDTPPPPVSAQAVASSLRPRERPDRPAPQPAAREPEQRQTRQAAPAGSNRPRAAQQSAGTGGSSRAGVAQQAAPQRLGPAAEQRLVATWGAQIRSRIERRKTHPGGRGGRVVVRLTVSRGGQITGAGIARSSGVAALDQAAMNAIRRAGRMPAAPAGLTQGAYSFNLPMDFN